MRDNDRDKHINIKRLAEYLREHAAESAAEPYGRRMAAAAQELEALARGLDDSLVGWG